MAQKLENVSITGKKFKRWVLNLCLELKTGIAFSKTIKFIHLTFLFQTIWEP